MVDAWELRGPWRQRVAGLAVIAPAYRRLRREAQWRRDGVRRLPAASGLPEPDGRRRR